MQIARQYSQWYHNHGDKSLERRYAKQWTATTFKNEAKAGKGGSTKNLFKTSGIASFLPKVVPQGGYYTINQVLEHYGYDSREEYLFPKPSFFQRLFNFGFVSDRDALLQKMTESLTEQWDLIHQNLSSVDLKNLKRYEVDLFDLKWKLMTKVERLDDQIIKLRAKNPMGVNNSEINSKTFLKWDILDELIPVSFEINEIGKAIINKKIM